MVGILGLDVVGSLGLDVVGSLDQVVLAVGGTFQAAPGKGQMAGSRELQGRVQAEDYLHMWSNHRLEEARKAVHQHEDSKSAPTRRSLGGSLIWTY